MTSEEESPTSRGRQGKPKQRTPAQVLAVNQWLDEEHGMSLPPELLFVIHDLISDWGPPAYPNPTHLRAYANIVAGTNIELAHAAQESKGETGSALNAAQESDSDEAPPSPYFEVSPTNASAVECVRQEFEPAHCSGAQRFAPGDRYHVTVRVTCGRAVAGHPQMQLIGTADRPQGHASDGSAADGSRQMSFSCSTEAFPRDKASTAGSTSMVDILIDLPENSERPLLRRLAVGTVSVRSEGGHRHLMLKMPFQPLRLYALVLCGAEDCVECGVGTRVEVVSSETVTKEEFKELLATQAARVPQKRSGGSGA